MRAQRQRTLCRVPSYFIPGLPSPTSIHGPPRPASPLLRAPGAPAVSPTASPAALVVTALRLLTWKVAAPSDVDRFMNDPCLTCLPSSHSIVSPACPHPTALSHLPALIPQHCLTCLPSSHSIVSPACPHPTALSHLPALIPQPRLTCLPSSHSIVSPACPHPTASSHLPANIPQPRLTCLPSSHTPSAVCASATDTACARALPPWGRCALAAELDKLQGEAAVRASTRGRWAERAEDGQHGGETSWQRKAGAAATDAVNRADSDERDIAGPAAHAAGGMANAAFRADGARTAQASSARRMAGERRGKQRASMEVKGFSG
ncbi:unnamed protein product [Closterium sp. Naga37s-1]|nr:unnamed protein product [Closterium sp. Naga37s-1]